MEVKLWGTRGSVPINGASHVRHGGATTCLTVHVDGHLFVIDCGTGIVRASREISERRFTVLQTHLHWDHIQGFPFFAPLFDPNRTIDFWAVPREGETMRDALVTQMSQPTFPVPLSIVPATLNFKDQQPTGREGCVSWTEVAHPSGSTAYRFDSNGESFVFTGDVEVNDCFDTLAEFCMGAGTIIIDAQYFPEEYQTKKGWGHSTFEHAIDVAIAAGVGRVYLTHHDPNHDDDVLDRKLARARRYAAGRVAVDNAYDGLHISWPVQANVAA